MKSYFNAIAIFSLAFACTNALAAGDASLAGTLKQGTLANQPLTHDAMLGVAARVAVLGCDKPENFVPCLVAMPTGEIGARHWKEKWLVKGCGKNHPVDIEFSEDGLRSANFTIRNR